MTVGASNRLCRSKRGQDIIPIPCLICLIGAGCGQISMHLSHFYDYFVWNFQIDSIYQIFKCLNNRVVFWLSFLGTFWLPSLLRRFLYVMIVLFTEYLHFSSTSEIEEPSWIIMSRWSITINLCWSILGHMVLGLCIEPN